MRSSQALNLQEKLLEFNNQFNDASDAVRARMLQEMDHELCMLTREEENISRIQDPSEIRGRRGRTFGKGGLRRYTAAEIVERGLKRSDKEARQQPTQSGVLLNTPSNALNQPSSSLLSNISSQKWSAVQEFIVVQPFKHVRKENNK